MLNAKPIYIYFYALVKEMVEIAADVYGLN